MNLRTLPPSPRGRYRKSQELTYYSSVSETDVQSVFIGELGSFSLHRLSYVRSSHVQGDIRVLEIGIEYIAACSGGQQPQYPFSPQPPGTPLSLAASGGAPAAPLLRVELMAPSGSARPGSTRSPSTSTASWRTRTRTRPRSWGATTSSAGTAATTARS